MASTVIDRFVTVLSHKTKLGNLRRYERETESTLARIGRKVDAFAKVGLRIGAVAVGVVAAGVRQLASFETSLAKIEGLVGISREQLDAWEDDLKALARETGQPLNDLAEGLFFITSAGLRGDDALEALRLSAMGATAQIADIPTIAKLATTAFNIFADDGLTLTQIMDQLTQAVRDGTVVPEELAASMGPLLTLANELGVSFGEVAGAQAAMSLQGLDANRSATSLRGVFSKLLKPTERARKELARVGLTVEDIRSSIGEQGLLPTLQKVREAFGDQSEALSYVFEDQEALVGVLALTGDKFEDAVRVINNVTGATGVLTGAYEAQEGTLAFKWARAMETAKQLLLDVADSVRPLADDVLEVTGAFSDWYGALGDNEKGFIGAATKAALAIGAISAAVRVFKFVWKPLAAILKGPGKFAIVGRFLGFVGVLWLLSDVVKAFQDDINKAVKDWPTPFRVAAEAITFVLANLFNPDEYRVGWEQIVDFFDLGGTLDGWIDSAWDAGGRFIGALVDGIASKVQDFYGTVESMFQWVRDRMPFSDAKEGPLADLTKSGRALIDTLAAGVKDRSGTLSYALQAALRTDITVSGSSALPAALRSAFQGLPALAAPLPVGPAPAAAGAGGDTTINIDVGPISITAPPGSDAEAIAGAIDGVLDDRLRRVAEQFASRVRA